MKIDKIITEIITETIGNNYCIKMTTWKPKHKIPLPHRVFVGQYNTLRRAKIILFEDCLSGWDETEKITDTKKISLAIRIEKSCFNRAIHVAREENLVASQDRNMFRQLYCYLCSKIASNLDKYGPVANTYLIKKILSGEISTVNLAKMISQDLYPEKYKDINAKIEVSEKIIFSKKTSAMYQCGKCYEKKCTLEYVINRSLDEGTSIYATCVSCGNKFGVSG